MAWLGESARRQGELAAGDVWFSRASELAERARFAYPLALARLGLGRIAIEQNDATSARANFEAALTAARTGPFPSLLTPCFCGLADIAADIMSARSLIGQALATAQRCKDKAGEALAFERQASLNQRQGDMRAATTRHRQALVLRARIGDPAAIADSLEACAALAAARDDFDVSSRLLGAVQAVREKHRVARSGSSAGEYRLLVESAREALGDERFRGLWEEGSNLSLRDAVSYAARDGAKRVDRPSTGWAALTETERVVAELAIYGRTNAQIARQLGITPATVKVHLRRVFAKLGVPNRQALKTYRSGPLAPGK
jgi:DNA-binding CsgD family transcriptional regulator